jgi:hypothetical protein
VHDVRAAHRAHLEVQAEAMLCDFVRHAIKSG